ncbi:MAG TPA: nitronate monooxygenase [Solirubrobacteraceae bacterium]
MFDVRTLRVPVVGAPLAGGPSTPELAAAVTQAGGLGFLAAGYKTAAAVGEDIATVRAATDAPFGVNVFVPTPEPADPAIVRAYVERIGGGEPRFDDDDWDAKLALLVRERPAVASFTFGLPDDAVIARLHDAGVAVWVTITTPGEAAMAGAADALVVQGAEAGGHRGGFTDGDDEPIALLPLLRLVAQATDRPLVAAGGIADAAGVAAVLAAGASAAQVGSALMLAPEAGTTPAQRAAHAAPGKTRLTRAFSGRRARGIVNAFMREHDAAAPRAYPEIHHATSAMRAAARERGDTDGFNLWAGQAHELAQAKPAAEIVRQLAPEHP